MKNLVIVSLCLLLFACGGGGSSSSSSSPGSASGDPVAAAEPAADVPAIATSYSSVTFGDVTQYSDASTLSAFVGRVKNYFSFKKLSPIQSAYAAAGCGNSRLIGGNESDQFSAIDVLGNAKSAGVEANDGASQECISSLQDSVDHIVFTATNLKSKNGTCDINFLRKADSRYVCLTTDISSALGVSGSISPIYQLGNLNVDPLDRTGYKMDYFTNHNGYQAAFTRNGKYLFAQFTATKSGRNYIGVTRFDLTSKNPVATVVWAKEQISLPDNTVDFHLRGFMALEYGDVIVDYVSNYSTTINDPTTNHPPLSVATRLYIAVDPATQLASSQKSFVLTYGGQTGFNLTGSLWDYLQNNQTTIPVGRFASATSYDPANSTVYPYSQANLVNGGVFISTDSSSSDKVLYLKLQADKTGSSSGLCDYVKVNIGANISTTPIQSIQYLGQTPSCGEASVILGNKLYSWHTHPYQVQVSGSPVSVSTRTGITVHPLNGSAATISEREFSPGTISGVNKRYLLQTSDSLFVLDGFTGYSGGCIIGQNSIYQTKLTNGVVSSQALNIGSLSSGRYILSNASANPRTNTLQLSGPKKPASGCLNGSYTLWSANIDDKPVSVKNFPGVAVTYAGSSPEPLSPIISIKNTNGTTPTYAKQ